MERHEVPTSTSTDDNNLGPAVAWLALGLLMAGLGTVLLGPILPTIQHRWHLTDQQAGPLFFTKFAGSFVGGISVPRRLRNGILSGTIFAAIGFAAFGLAPNLPVGAATLFVAGFGLGQIIASTNILAGHRYTNHTGSALATLNFFFSFGTVVTGIIVAIAVPDLGLARMLLIIGAALSATGILGKLQTAKAVHPASEQPTSSAVTRYTIIVFATFLFFYGGLETCLAGWITTFSQRYSQSHIIGGQSAVVLLLAALACGRLLSSVALRFTTERLVQRSCLLLSLFCVIGLSTASRAGSLAFWSVTLGVSIAPFFPATFAMLMRHTPTARQAGFVLAVSGLGAATFPWLMGIISTHTGSLREAMCVPALLSLVLLAVSFLPEGKQSRVTPTSTPSLH
jgi:FHS family glucose/mannose:H+ symporter-like MFS transporter